jgi:hypothetical protein
VRMISLVDFDNDCVGTSLAVARALGERLWGVRLDTSEGLVDRSLGDEMGDFDPRGVNPRLVERVRTALDREGFENVGIVVSGGFSAEKIRRFEDACVPVDSYGVGSALVRGSYDSEARRARTCRTPSSRRRVSPDGAGTRCSAPARMRRSRDPRYRGSLAGIRQPPSTRWRHPSSSQARSGDPGRAPARTHGSPRGSWRSSGGTSAATRGRAEAIARGTAGRTQSHGTWT